MKRLPEIFIFLLSFAYTDSLDTDVSHVIVDHKGNSIIAIVDSMDLNTVYYTNKSDNKVSTIDIDKVDFIYNDFDRVYHYDWSYYENLRRITSIMPDLMLRLFSKFLATLTYPYGFFCKFLPLPLRKYFVTMFNKFSFKHRSYVIFDQFNPSFYKYFSKTELQSELNDSGFEIESLVNTVGHQYTVVCKKKM